VRRITIFRILVNVNLSASIIFDFINGCTAFSKDTSNRACWDNELDNDIGFLFKLDGLGVEFQYLKLANQRMTTYIK